MSRLDVRCEVNLPVTVIFQNNSGETTEIKSQFSNLSLGGGLILGKHLLSPKNILNIRYNLPTYRETKVHGEIIRYDSSGTVTRFVDINKEDKIRLWEYLRDHIPYISHCPYCRNEYISSASECETCGLKLNFHSPDYVINHERELFMKKLSMKSTFFSLEDISRVMNFIDVQILGIGELNAEVDKLERVPLGLSSITFDEKLSGSISLKEAMLIIEKQKLIEALKKYNNNISKVAKALEVSRPTVYKMMKKYGMCN